MAAADHANSTYDRMKELKEFDKSKSGVKGLADAGITSIPRFFVHPPDTLDLKKPTSQKCTKKTIPVIDLSLFNTPTKRHQLVEQIREATSTWGFFQIINHGIPISVLDKTLDAIKAFHDEPHEVKSKLYNRDNERNGVQYSSNNDLYRAKAASWHDSLSVWMSPETKRAKEEDIPEVCRKEIIAWELHASKVAEALLELLSEGLGVEADRFKELGFLEGKLLVGHCYPYCPEPDLTLGIASHTDTGLTVLWQNQVGGLQVKHDDEWVDVEPLPGALTINIGDFIQVYIFGKIFLQIIYLLHHFNVFFHKFQLGQKESELYYQHLNWYEV
jgi:isopenicillin N synthase-like dioxygenase